MRWFLLIVCLIIGLSSHAAAPTCALIPDPSMGFDQSPLFALIEARAAQHDDLSLLDRAEIAKVLKEQQLSAVFGASNLKDRVAMGLILHADLLVLLQVEKVPGGAEKTRTLHMAVAETKTGLRLFMQTIPCGEDDEASAQNVDEVLAMALERVRQPITGICAVPPFISNDLTHQYDHLQTAYARLLEEALLARPGMVVVELEEARALSAEMALTAGNAAVKRPAPLYLLGDYRNDGVQDQRRMIVHLELKQGEQRLREVKSPELLPAAVPAFLVNAFEPIFRDMTTLPAPAWNAEQEAAQLFARADKFRKIGNYREALTLCQASLLLMPEQPKVLFDTAVLATQVAGQYPLPRAQSRGDADFNAAALTRLRYYWQMRQAFDEYQRITGAATDPYYDIQNSIVYNYREQLGEYPQLFGWLMGVKENDPPSVVEFNAEYERVCEDDARHLQRYLATLAAAGKRTHVYNIQRFLHTYYNWSAFHPADERVWKLRLELMGLLCRAGDPQQGTIKQGVLSECAVNGLTTTELDSPRFETFLTEVAAIDHPDIAGALKLIRRKQAIALKRPLPTETPVAKPPVMTNPPATPAPPVTPDDVRFTKVTTTIVNSKSPREPGLINFIPCGPGVDVGWSIWDIYLMKEKGVLRHIYHTDPVYAFESYYALCYDGRYIWAVKEGSIEPQGNPEDEKAPAVLVIDPLTEEIRKFTVADGLPNQLSFGVVGAVAPGQVCVAAFLGRRDNTGYLGRTWVGLLSLNDAGKKSLEIVYEARQQYDQVRETDAGYKQAAASLETAFLPSFILPLREKPDAPLQFLIGRTVSPRQQFATTLLFDPAARTVKILDVDLLPGMVRDGQLYVFRYAYGNGGNGLFRIGSPDWTLKLIGDLSETNGNMTNQLLFYQDHGYLLDRMQRVLMTVEPDGSKLRRLNGKYTDISARLCLSRHYGLLLLQQGTLYTVEFLRLTAKPFVR